MTIEGSIKVFEIDSEGNFIGEDWIPEDQEVPLGFVTEPYPDGMFMPKWDGNKWIAGLTAEEIEAIRNVPVEPSEIESLRIDNKMNAIAIMELASYLMGGE